MFGIDENTQEMTGSYELFRKKTISTFFFLDNCCRRGVNCVMLEVALLG